MPFLPIYTLMDNWNIGSPAKKKRCSIHVTAGIHYHVKKSRRINALELSSNSIKLWIKEKKKSPWKTIVSIRRPDNFKNFSRFLHNCLLCHWASFLIHFEKLKVWKWFNENCFKMEYWTRRQLYSYSHK